MPEKSGDNMYTVLKYPIAIVTLVLILFIGRKYFNEDFRIKKIKPTEIEFFPMNSEDSLSPQINNEDQTDVKEETKKKRNGDNNLKSKENRTHTNNFESIRACFEKFDGRPLKKFSVIFQGYSIDSKTDSNGCIILPVEIIKKEKVISSYTVRLKLIGAEYRTDYFEVSINESSIYNVKLK